MITINSNIYAHTIQRQLNAGTERIGRIFEQLSSGYRITRGVDDPAGLAVSLGLGLKVRTQRQAKRNIQDGTSLLDIADSALGELSNLLTRMRELAAQAANGTLGHQQRKTLQAEFAELQKEIYRITKTTKFNGIELGKGGLSQISHSGAAPAPMAADGNPISPDGRYAYYGQATGLFRFDMTTGRSEQLATGSFSSAKLYAVNNGDVFVGNVAQRKIQVYRAASGTVEDITPDHGIAEAFSGFVASADGTTIAFRSSARYVNGGTIDDYLDGTGGNKLTVIDVASRTVKQINSTVSQYVVGSLHLSSDGSQLVFASGADLVGEGAVGGRIFRVDTTANTIAFQAITDTTSSDTNTKVAGITNSGKIYFSRAGYLGHASTTLFEFDSSSGSARVLQDLVSAPVALTMNSIGTSINLISGNDLMSNGNSGSQVFQFDLTTGELEQRTFLNSASSARLDSNPNGVFLSKDGKTVLQNTNVIGEDGLYTQLEQQGANLAFETGLGSAGILNVELDGILSALHGLGEDTITSQGSAQAALDNLATHIDSISTIRGKLGASQSRFQVAARLADSNATEFAQAQSRILDVDIASAQAEATRLQILNEIRTSLLAQANQQPELALTLLEP